MNASPRDGELRIRLGDAYFKLEEYKKARTHFQRAAKLGHSSARRRLALVDEALSGR